jgi:hypothetical protein
MPLSYVARAACVSLVLVWLAGCSGETEPLVNAEGSAGGETVADVAPTADSGVVEADAGVGEADSDATAALPPLPEAWSPQETDFDCLTQGRSVRGFWLSNPLGPEYEDEAVRIAEAGMMEALPPGTIIQLVPQEAMVKLLPGSDAATGDWEYFNLAVDSTGTTILERGGAEVSNSAGSCLSCHAGAVDRDFVCEQTGLCAAAAVPRAIVDALVAGDERCP